MASGTATTVTEPPVYGLIHLNLFCSSRLWRQQRNLHKQPVYLLSAVVVYTLPETLVSISTSTSSSTSSSSFTSSTTIVLTQTSQLVIQNLVCLVFSLDKKLMQHLMSINVTLKSRQQTARVITEMHQPFLAS